MLVLAFLQASRLRVLETSQARYNWNANELRTFRIFIEVFRESYRANSLETSKKMRDIRGSPRSSFSKDYFHTILLKKYYWKKYCCYYCFSDIFSKRFQINYKEVWHYDFYVKQVLDQGLNLKQQNINWVDSKTVSRINTNFQKSSDEANYSFGHIHITEHRVLGV